MRSTKTTPTNTGAAAPLWRPEVLDRLEFILLLAAMALAVLVYPLRLHENWLRALSEAWDLGASPQGPFWARFSREQFEPLLGCYVSPLLLKGVLAAIPMLAFIALRGIRGLLMPTPPVAGRWAWAGVLTFFGWMALSAVWSPTPELAVTAAFWVALFGVFFFMLLRRGLTPGELRVLAYFLILMGLPVLAIVLLEALPLDTPILGGKIFYFLFQFEGPRNRYGSLLGHNTAAASFLLMTVFPCLFLLAEAGSRPGRAAWRARLSIAAHGAYLGLALLAIAVLQSRAVWVFLPILGFLALRSILRQTRQGGGLPRWLPTVLLALLALVVLSQSIDRPWNPFHIKGNPLGRRIKDLGPEGLRNEARLRLNIISATLVPEHSLKGHGLYAFQFVYPRRQAEYFKEHPGSRLNMTRDRSDMAHNEYMQVLVDHGAIGLALMGWGLWEIAARGRRRRRGLAQLRNAEGGALPDWRLNLLHEGVGWSALAFALHALVDFPFHLPQLAVPGLLLMTGWGALRLEADPQASLAPASRWRVFPRPMGALLLALLVPLGGWTLVRALQSDICYSRAKALGIGYNEAMQTAYQQKNNIAGVFAAWGQRIGSDPRLAPADRKTLGERAGQLRDAFLVDAAHDAEITPEVKAMLMRRTLELTDALARAKADPETILPGEQLLLVLREFEDFTMTKQVLTLELAVDNFQQAIAIGPYHELLPQELAENCLVLAQIFRKAALKAATGDASLAQRALGRAEAYLNQGLEQLEVAARGLDVNRLYLTRARIYRELDKLHPGQGHLARYRENLALAQFYCPAETRVTRELIALLQSDPRPDKVRIRQLARQYMSIDFGAFHADYILPAYEAIKDQRYALAARLWEELVAIAPENPEFMNTAIRVQMLAGNYKRMLELTDILSKNNNFSRLSHGSLITELTFTRDETRLFQWFHYLNPSDPLNRAECRAMEIVTRRLFKRDPNEAIYTRPDGVNETTWNNMVAEEIPRVLFHYFRETAQARQAMNERLSMTGEPPSVRFWIEGFYIAEAQGDQPFMRQCLERARAARPDAPALPDLEARLKEAGGRTVAGGGIN